MTTCFGWQRYLNGKAKVGKDGKLKSIRNSLLNWPIQAHGSEILRHALIELNKNNFEVNCPVHDAFLISIPIGEFESRLDEAKKIMMDSAAAVCGPIKMTLKKFGKKLTIIKPTPMLQLNLLHFNSSCMFYY